MVYASRRLGIYTSQVRPFYIFAARRGQFRDNPALDGIAHVSQQLKSAKRALMRLRKRFVPWLYTFLARPLIRARARNLREIGFHFSPYKLFQALVFTRSSSGPK
jgi:hypothetical protein